MKKILPPRPREKKEKRKKTECPYLISNFKICMRMVEKGLDGKVSSFDIEHYCRGKPSYCYHFRFRHSKR